MSARHPRLSDARRGRRGERGFTLVELIIALSLIGLITLLLFSGLRLGSRAWEGVETSAERTAELRVTRNFIERALAQARPATTVLDGEPLLIFSGDATNIEFVAPLSEHAGIPGLYILRLTLDQDSRQPRVLLTRWLLNPEVLEGGAYIQEWAPFDGSSDLHVDEDELDRDLAAGAFGTSLMVENVADFEIAYLSRTLEDEEPEWYEEWIEQSELPAAVRLRLTTVEQSWPDMLIPLPDFFE